MAFDLCVIPVSTVPYLSALQTRQLSMTEITAHLVSEKLTCEQCHSMTPETFSSSYGSSSHALHVRSSVSSEINLSITSPVYESAPTGYTIVIQGYLNDLNGQNSPIVLGVCVSDEPLVADASLRLFVNIEETKNVFRLSADFDGMVTQGLLDDLLERYVTTDTKQTITSTKTLHSGAFRTNLNISDIAVEYVPSSTSGHISTATLASDGIHADGVSFKNAYGRAADNYLVASVRGNGGYSELSSLGGHGFTFCYKGADETDNHYPLRIEAGITMFDENQTLHLAKDTNTYLHVDDDTLSVKDYVERIVGSGSSKFVVADVDTLDPTQLSNLTDYRQYDESSNNPHYNSNKASFKFDVSELPSNGMTFEVFMPSTSFVGSVQLVCGSSNYIYPIYFRGDDNVHCPTVPQGSVLRITFYNDAFYGDFYDLADFGDGHEAYVYVGKVPVDKSSSDLSKFSGLVGINRDTGKFSQMFTVEVTSNGAFANSPRLRENSPIYACFQGDCFAAHPKVPFGNILRIADEFYIEGTLQIHLLPFTYYPFDDGDTVEAHIVVNTSSQSANKYFQVDDCPVYIQADSNSVLIGNPPADIHARLIGFMCSGAENAGMIRLVENDAVFYVSDDDYSKIFAGVWDYNTVDLNTPTLSGSPLSSDSDNVLVVLSKSSSKLVPLLVPGPCDGDVMVNTQFDWESPIYALFKGFRCFSAHPMVNFIQIFGSNSGANSPVFISDHGEMYETDKRFCVGIPSDVNSPSSDIHWRLLGYTTSTPGYIRLTESHPFLKDFIYQTGGYVKLSDFTVMFDDDYYGSVNSSQYVDYLRTNYGYDLSGAVQALVSNHGDTVFNIKDLATSSVYASESDDGEVYVRLPSMTTVEFEDRMSFRTSAGEAAYIDRYGVYHGRALEADTSVNATRSQYATELNVSDGVSTLAYFRYGSSTSTWDTDKGINPTLSETLSLGSNSKVWKDIYGCTLHAWGDGASFGLRLCDWDCESRAYSSITGFQDQTNGLMKFHHYNAENDIDYVVTSTGPNTTNTSETAATLRTVPQTTGTWTVGSSSYKLAAVYANTFYGDLSGNASSATTATRATQDGSGNTIMSTYGSSLRTYTRAANNSSAQGSIDNRYIELYSNYGSSLGRVYISDIIANALRGYGGFGWGTSPATSSAAGYRTYNSHGSVGSLGLFTVIPTYPTSYSAGSVISGTSLHPVKVCDYGQTSYTSSGTTSGLGDVDIRAVHYGATMPGTWYVLNNYGGFTNLFAWFVIAVRVY